MAESNPFAAPDGSEWASEEEAEFATQVAQRLRASLAWHLILGVFGLLIAALMVGLGLTMVLFGGLVPEDPNSPIGTEVAGGLYVVLSTIYGVPSVLLLWSGITTARVGRSQPPDRARTLAALDARKWFWHISGGGCLSMVVLYIGVIVLAVVVGIGAAL